jgi:hypothetical protein
LISPIIFSRTSLLALDHLARKARLPRQLPSLSAMKPVVATFGGVWLSVRVMFARPRVHTPRSIPAANSLSPARIESFTRFVLFFAPCP